MYGVGCHSEESTMVPGWFHHKRIPRDGSTGLKPRSEMQSPYGFNAQPAQAGLVFQNGNSLRLVLVVRDLPTFSERFVCVVLLLMLDVVNYRIKGIGTDAGGKVGALPLEI